MVPQRNLNLEGSSRDVDREGILVTVRTGHPILWISRRELQLTLPWRSLRVGIQPDVPVLGPGLLARAD